MTKIFWITSTYPKQFSADALLKQTKSKSFTIDALLQKQQSKTFTIDSLVKKTQSKTFTFDAILAQERLSFKAGRFAKSATIVGLPFDQAVTGVGFTPKLVFFWHLGSNSNPTDIYRPGFGFSDGTNHRGLGWGSDDNVVANTFRRAVNTEAMAETTNATPQVEFKIKTFDTDGFTITFDTNNTSTADVYYIAIGGSDVTNVKAGSITAATSTGDTPYTGVGFKPDIVFFAGANVASLSTNTAGLSAFLGVAKSSSERHVCALGSEDTSGTTDSAAYQRTDKCIAFLTPSDVSVVDGEADFVSMDSDGFTLNWGNAAAAGNAIFYLAIKGGAWSVGTFNQPTSTGNQSITAGVRPKGIILQSYCRASSTSIQDGLKHAFGAGNSDGSRWSIFGADSDNVNPSVTARARLLTNVIRCLTEAATGSSSTLDSAADLLTLDDSGFTLNWTTADATAREILYVAAAESPIEKSLTADAIVKKTQSKTASADAVIVNVRSKTFALDAMVKATKTKTFTTDAFVKKTQSKSFSADAMLRATFAKSFAIDSLVKKTSTKSFAADALLKATLSKQFSCDAFIRKQQSKNFTLDSLLQKRQSKTLTADALLLQSNSKTFSLDAVVKQSKTKSFALDSLVKKFAQTKSFSIDACISKQQTKTFAVDSLVRQTNSKSFAIDALLLATRTKSVAVDSLLKQSVTKTFAVDALLRKTSSKQFTVDAIAKKSQSKSAQLDALVLKSQSKSFIVDATLLAAGTKQVTINAVLQKSQSKTFTLDSIISAAVTPQTRTKTLAIDAFLAAAGQAQGHYGDNYGNNYDVSQPAPGAGRRKAAKQPYKKRPLFTIATADAPRKYVPSLDPKRKKVKITIGGVVISAIYAPDDWQNLFNPIVKASLSPAAIIGEAKAKLQYRTTIGLEAKLFVYHDKRRRIESVTTTICAPLISQAVIHSKARFASKIAEIASCKLASTQLIQSISAKLQSMHHSYPILARIESSTMANAYCMLLSYSIGNGIFESRLQTSNTQSSKALLELLSLWHASCNLAYQSLRNEQLAKLALLENMADLLDENE